MKENEIPVPEEQKQEKKEEEIVKTDDIKLDSNLVPEGTITIEESKKEEKEKQIEEEGKKPSDITTVVTKEGQDNINKDDNIPQQIDVIQSGPEIKEGEIKAESEIKEGIIGFEIAVESKPKEEPEKIILKDDEMNIMHTTEAGVKIKAENVEKKEEDDKNKENETKIEEIQDNNLGIKSEEITFSSNVDIYKAEYNNPNNIIVDEFTYI